MLNHFLAIVIATVVTLTGFAGNAQENPGDRNDDRAVAQQSFANIVALGPGVHRIKTNRNGQVQSCIVVGQSRVSTVLGTAKGLQTARIRARLGVAAEFVKWLRQDVCVRDTIEDETVLHLEGRQDGDKVSRNESGKAVEKNTVHFTAVSQGLVRGLQVLHVDVNGKDGVYTLVMGWSADGAAAARQAAQDEALTPVRRSSTRQTNTAGSIRSRQATSEEAGKFLD